MSSSGQKLDWLHNLVRTTGDATNAVVTQQNLEARLREHNDQLYTRCMGGDASGFPGTHTQQHHQSALVGGGESVFLAQLRDALGPDVSAPSRNEGGDLLSWKKRVVDAAAQTFAELHARLLSGGDKEPQAVQQLKSATQQLKAQLGDSSVMSVLSQCGGVDDSVIGDLKTRLQQLNNMKQRLGGGGYVQATEINELLRQTVGTLGRYVKRIRTDAASKGESGRKLQAALAQHKQLEAEKANLQNELTRKKQNLEGLRAEHGQKLTEASAQAADLKNTQELNNNLKAELDGKVQAFDEKRASLVAQLEEKRTNIAQLETELHKSQKAYENAKKGLKEALDKEKKQCNVEDEALTAFNAQLEKLKAVLAGGALLKGGATKTAKEILRLASEMVNVALEKVASIKKSKADAETQCAADADAALAQALKDKQEELAAAANEKKAALDAARATLNEEKQKALDATRATLNEEKQKALDATRATAEGEKKAALDSARATLNEEKQKAAAAETSAATANAERDTAQQAKEEAVAEAAGAAGAAAAAAAAASETLRSTLTAAKNEADAAAKKCVANAKESAAEAEREKNEALTQAAAKAEHQKKTDAAQSREMSMQLRQMQLQLKEMKAQLAGEQERANAAEATQIDDTDDTYQSFLGQLKALRSTLAESSDDSAEAQSNEELFKKKSLKPEH